MTNLIKLPSWADDNNIFAVVETPRGSSCKLEFDPKLGAFALAKPLIAGLTYPYDWGFIPSTKAEDGDPLDVLILSQEPVLPLTIVEGRAIGVMRMRDEKGIDDKIVAISVRDPSFADYTHVNQLPGHVMRQVRRFFEDYKVLENKQVVVEDLLGPDDAVKIILDAMDLYGKLRRGELHK